MPSILIAGASTNSGKTVITSAILRELKNRGMKVNGAKVGPDYIDPKFHAISSGAFAYNLDCWAMREDTLSRNLDKLQQEADLTIIEGVMGLFDGAADGTASPAHLAKKFDIPIVLVLDVFGQSQSISAIVKGFDCLNDNISISGVILTKVGSDNHLKLLEDSLKKYIPHIPLLGAIRRSKNFELKSRHLGLVQPSIDNNKAMNTFVEKTASIVSKSIDLNAFCNIAKPAKTISNDSISLPSFGNHIAIAYDEAFSFCYPHIINEWKSKGVKISFFSPVNDEIPDTNADAIYFCGGYPELYAEKLSNNINFKTSVRQKAKERTFIFGECGGFMTLGNSITDADGNKHKMLGLLDLDTSFQDRKLHLGYRQMKLQHDCLLGNKGSIIRGHEFHYATIVQQSGDSLFEITDALNNNLGSVGLKNGNVYGSFMHLIDKL